jgi:choline dehydrogenase-like flavoprotein
MTAATTDVVVIGSGAGGAPLAMRLSRAGFDVIVLERGPRYDRGDFPHEEVFLPLQEQFVPSLDDDPHVLVDHGLPTPEPKRTRLGWTACCVGGGTAHMGGRLLRFHPDDFRLAERHGAFEEIADWPYDYASLEPYYSQAEWSVGVSGAAGANPFVVFRTRVYPMPPLGVNPIARALDAGCARLGLHAYPTPHAVNSVAFDGRPACTHCDFCAGYGCPTGARGSMTETMLPRALATGRCVIVANAMVRAITLGPRRSVTGCVYIDAAGAEHRVRAAVVCVACSAVESARLLLLSKSPAFPDGLANGTGLVGRHLQFHTASMARGRFTFDRHPSLALHERGAMLGRAVMDHYVLDANAAPSAWPKGGVLAFELSLTHPVADAMRIARTEGDRLLWGRALQERLGWAMRDTRQIEAEVFHDFVPNRGTYVELDPVVTDRWGLPAARLHLTEPAHHRAAGAWLVDRSLEILAAMGADECRAGGIGYVNGVMAHGTCRSGADPRRAVLNAFCQSHEIPNLFVVDGSFMPTSGGAPSTLTIIANSLRTADFLIDRARTRDLN